MIKLQFKLIEQFSISKETGTQIVNNIIYLISSEETMRDLYMCMLPCVCMCMHACVHASR